MDRKRLSALIEPNANSPLKIMDVRSINAIEQFSYAVQNEAAADSDDSSGSEKELVIDLAEEEPPDVEKLGPDEPADADEPTATGSGTKSNKAAAPERINRRKSQHVLIKDAEVEFDVPVDRILPDNGFDQNLSTNHNIMKHIALLRTSINYFMDKLYDRTFAFDAGPADIPTMDAWIKDYETIRKGNASRVGSNVKRKKKT